MLVVLAALGVLFVVGLLAEDWSTGESLERDELAPVAGAGAAALTRARGAEELGGQGPVSTSGAAMGRDTAAVGVRLAGNGKLAGVVLERGSGLGVGGARVELLALPPIGSVFLGPFIWGLFSRHHNRLGGILSSVLGLALCLGWFFLVRGGERQYSPEAGTLGMACSLLVWPLPLVFASARGSRDAG